MAKQLIIGLLVVAVGGVLIYFSGILVESFGTISRAENKLGGTRNGYLLVGFGLMIIGMLILFGVIPTSSPAANLPTFGNVQ